MTPFLATNETVFDPRHSAKKGEHKFWPLLMVSGPLLHVDGPLLHVD